ncbi:hypothetical protein PAXINDRAFT_10319 [Paxillus involutus ATCC 200175]|nr:hypothetical protein PAXINDRAFT_10319 [Paxillus involutus ATCC 200175]
MQLLESGLLSATIDQPKTAFSFSVLNDFIRDNLECGTSASNYYNKLRRITSNVFPHLVPDRYHELLRVSRQWRLLKLLKWAGFGHQKDSKSLEPSINVYPDVTNDLSNWKYNQTLIMDGNFKAEHLYDRQTDGQVWLMDGLGFMVSRSPYHEYLAATNHALERSSCNNHRAVNQANSSRVWLEATGIGATACAHHGCFVPHSVVDFQRGERKLRQRVGNNKFLKFPTDMEIIPGIGIWHVHGHQPQCFSRYAPLYIEGAGWIDGEVIETLWSILNVVSTSTRGMSSPHRQELLNFQMNDSNFMKMIRMGRHLSAKWKNALSASRAAGRAFDSLDSGMPEAERRHWMDMERATLNTWVDDPSAMDIFQLKTNKAASVRTVEMDLLGQHASSVETPQGTVTWLAQGPAIEESAIHVMKDQRSLKSTATDVQKLAVVRRMDRLSSDISKFIDAATVYMGSAIEDHDDTAADEAES